MLVIVDLFCSVVTKKTACEFSSLASGKANGFYITLSNHLWTSPGQIAYVYGAKEVLRTTQC